MTDLEIAILIIGLTAIIAVMIHGIWTLRKQKIFNSHQHTTTKRKATDSELGVSDVRVVGENKAKEQLIKQNSLVENPQNNRAKDLHIKVNKAPKLDSTVTTKADVIEQLELSLDEAKQEPVFDIEQVLLDEQQQPKQEQNFDFEDEVSHSEREALFNQHNNDEPQQPVAPAQSNIVEATPVNVDEARPAHVDEATSVNVDEARPVNVDEAAPVNVNEVAPVNVAKPAPEKPVEPQILLLSVHAQEGKILDGKELLPLLLELGLKYGDMDIFHRYSDVAGQNEAPVFSVANMINPGTFDLDSMDKFTTLGVSFFMDIAAVNNTHARFNAMHKSAQILADALGAMLLDDKRQPLTEGSLASYHQIIDQVTLSAAQ